MGVRTKEFFNQAITDFQRMFVVDYWLEGWIMDQIRTYLPVFCNGCTWYDVRRDEIK